MKSSIYFAVIVVATQSSCHYSPSAKSFSNELQGSKEIKLELQDSLGIVEFSVPDYYDTSYSWISRSDCGKPCEKQMYRYQPKALPVVKESGFIWLNEPKDSVDRLTISYSRYVVLQKDSGRRDPTFHEHFREKYAYENTEYSMVFDTLLEVSGRYFSVTALQKLDSMESEKLFCATTVLGNPIEFRYELLTRNKDSARHNFLKNSLDLLKKVRFNKTAP